MRNRIIFISIVTIVAFAAGKYTGRQIIVHENEQIKTATDTTIVTVKEPGGKETTTTVIKEREITKKELSKVEMPKKPVLNVALLGAYDLRSTDKQPIYGISISKEFIGPVTLGAFYMTDGVVGLSVGVNF